MRQELRATHSAPAPRTAVSPVRRAAPVGRGSVPAPHRLKGCNAARQVYTHAFNGGAYQQWGFTATTL
jgi:hypothetical protein